MPPLTNHYDELTATARDDLGSDLTKSIIIQIVRTGLDLLETQCNKEPLDSKVQDKEYFHFLRAPKISRPVNNLLYDPELTLRTIEDSMNHQFVNLETAERKRVLYTSVISYCCGADILKSNDRKTPGTFFEIFIAHQFSKVYETNPTKSIPVLNLDRDTNLPTDFVFDLGENKSRIHLPVKTSTRERVIQVWAHQKVLDGVYGINRFRGVLVCLNETNKQSRTKSVIEVCLPDQWKIYQMFIAQLYRIYYLDVPDRYRELSSVYPFIHVKDFSDFFDESEALVSFLQ